MAQRKVTQAVAAALGACWLALVFGCSGGDAPRADHASSEGGRHAGSGANSTGGSSAIGGAAQGGHHAGGTSVQPFDAADDDQPYALLPSCDTLPRWTIDSLARVHAISPTEAWVITQGAGYEGSGGRLLYLRSDGQVEDTGITSVHDVWSCDAEIWVVGDSGQAWRKPKGAPFERIETQTDAAILGGFGCGQEVWLAPRDHILRITEGKAQTVALGIDGNGRPLKAVRVHGAGTARMATAYYGHIMLLDEHRGTFEFVGGTDDIITDAFVRRDGSGISLHGGYGLILDPADPISYRPVEGLVASRVDRRSDSDAWFVGPGKATHYDGSTFTPTALPALLHEDVDARADSVWVVGFDGAAVRTDAGFCLVTSKPDKPE